MSPGAAKRVRSIGSMARNSTMFITARSCSLRSLANAIEQDAQTLGDGLGALQCDGVERLWSHAGLHQYRTQFTSLPMFGHGYLPLGISHPCDGWRRARLHPTKRAKRSASLVTPVNYHKRLRLGSPGIRCYVIPTVVFRPDFSMGNGTEVANVVGRRACSRVSLLAVGAPACRERM